MTPDIDALRVQHAELTDRFAKADRRVRDFARDSMPDDDELTRSYQIGKLILAHDKVDVAELIRSTFGSFSPLERGAFMTLAKAREPAVPSGMPPSERGTHSDLAKLAGQRKACFEAIDWSLANKSIPIIYLHLRTEAKLAKEQSADKEELARKIAEYAATRGYSIPIDPAANKAIFDEFL